jgi:hypothetical protein
MIAGRDERRQAVLDLGSGDFASAAASGALGFHPAADK